MKCRKCGKKVVGREPWHKEGFCSWKHQIEYGEDNLIRSAKRIGSYLGEIYNPGL